MAEEEWDFVDGLKQTRSSCVCMTCQHFSYVCDQHCHTLLTCGLQRRQVPHGEQRSKRCRNWMVRRKRKWVGARGGGMPGTRDRRLFRVLQGSCSADDFVPFRYKVRYPVSTNTQQAVLDQSGRMRARTQEVKHRVFS